MPELAGNLEQRSFECFRIGAYVALAYRSLHVRQLNMKLLSELVTQAVRRHAELTLGNAGLLHHVVEALEGLLQRQAGMSQMRTIFIGFVATALCLALFVCTGMIYACISFLQAC